MAPILPRDSPTLSTWPAHPGAGTAFTIPRKHLADNIPLLHRAVTTVLNFSLSAQQRAPEVAEFNIMHQLDANPRASITHTSPLHLRRQSNSLAPRQGQVFAIPLSYDFSGPAPGTVIGIVLGVVGGIILIIILFWAAFSVSPGGDEVIVVDTEGSRSDYLRSRRSRRRRSSKYEMRQHRSRSHSHSPPPPPRRARTERIIVQETRRTESRPPPVQINLESRPLSPARGHRVVGDDVVEVIEEQSESSSSVPPPRRKSKRTSGGSYRVVDPNAYAGGNYAPRDVYDDRRRSKR